MGVVVAVVGVVVVGVVDILEMRMVVVTMLIRLVDCHHS